MKVYFVGAQATGKTTLARYVSKAHDLPLVTEVARRLRAEAERSLDEIRADLDAIDTFQERIFTEQVAAEQRAGDSFVADRSLDHYAYAASHSRIGWWMAKHEPFREYVEALKNHLVFFVRPHRELVRADGDRSTLDLAWDAVVAIDAQVQLLLEMHGIPYFPVPMLSMRDRVKMVDGVIAMAKDNERLRRQVVGHCERIAKQSDLLSQRAERREHAVSNNGNAD